MGNEVLKPYLYGTKFTIVTHHKPLTWVMCVKNPESRLLKWRIKLEEYDYEIVFKKSTSNTNADALSGVSSLTADKGVTEERRQQVTDEETKATITHKYHDSPVGGRRGMNKTFREIRRKYEWPNMKRNIENYIKKCQS
jgi:hypothetical protein